MHILMSIMFLSQTLKLFAKKIEKVKIWVITGLTKYKLGLPII